MLELYKGFVDHYGVVTIEDPYEQDDWDNWKVGGHRGARGRGRGTAPFWARPCGRATRLLLARPPVDPGGVLARATGLKPPAAPSFSSNARP
jgi:hypothetical protein